ncbi:hypothetical protein BRC81_02135 [Halobacteriales archaeon QS_1_68_20]|nr:MAG: hypothetical protein BRC81_02135 [Halobacteriales archaeon QS_1_68_20]
MRELTFELTYERGADRLADCLIDHPNLALRSLVCFAAGDRVWRRVDGPPAGVSDLEATIAEWGCWQLRPEADGGDHDAEVLASEDGRRVIYSRYRDGDPPRSVPALAARHFDGGLVFENERAGDRARWGVLMPNGAGTGAFCRAASELLGDDVSFHFDHVGQATDWRPFAAPSAEVSPEQRAALEAAIDHGYYEIPRQIDVDDLAARLDVPRSTLSYRLRRAEQRLALSSVALGSMSDSVLPPPAGRTATRQGVPGAVTGDPTHRAPVGRAVSGPRRRRGTGPSRQPRWPLRASSRRGPSGTRRGPSRRRRGCTRG